MLFANKRLRLKRQDGREVVIHSISVIRYETAPIDAIAENLLAWYSKISSHNSSESAIDIVLCIGQHMGTDCQQMRSGNVQPTEAEGRRTINAATKAISAL
jgi:hypothetical protein